MKPIVALVWTTPRGLHGRIGSNRRHAGTQARRGTQMRRHACCCYAPLLLHATATTRHCCYTPLLLHATAATRHCCYAPHTRHRTRRRQIRCKAGRQIRCNSLPLPKMKLTSSFAQASVPSMAEVLSCMMASSSRCVAYSGMDEVSGERGLGQEVAIILRA